jgi:glutathione peroxidase
MIKKSTVLLLAVLASVSVARADSPTPGQKPADAKKEAAAMSSVDYLNIPFQTITGDKTRLSDFKGKVVLIVNTASKCGYTPQYEGLESLYELYKDSGLVVIGFPANNFGEQEPGSDKEIAEFCSTKFDVKFPMMSKVSVKGDDIHPLFKYLTEGAGINGEIGWNFSKFLLDRNGKLVARYPSKVTPQDPELTGEIRKLL